MTDTPDKIWVWLDRQDEPLSGEWAQPDKGEPLGDTYYHERCVPRWSSDMEAAPKDGTRILTFHPANPNAIIERARRDNWVVNEWRGLGWYRSLPEQTPIAWMLLPAPPKGETE